MPRTSTQNALFYSPHQNMFEDEWCSSRKAITAKCCMLLYCNKWETLGLKIGSIYIVILKYSKQRFQNVRAVL